MAINPATQYPGKTTVPDSEYPYGGARNVTTPGDGTGTPWEAALLNDLFGMQQALLSAAGLTASGTPDNALESQYLDAMQSLGGRVAATVADMVDMGLKPGWRVRTVDYYSTQRGGGASYLIKTTAQADADGDVYSATTTGNILLYNGNVAVIQLVNSRVTATQYGAVSGMDSTGAIGEYLSGVWANKYEGVLDGLFLVSSKLDIPFSQDWKLSATSRVNGLIQTTDNIPIFDFVAANTHSWEISNMYLGHSTMQTGNVEAACILYSSEGSTGSGQYNAKVKRITFDYSYWLARVTKQHMNAAWGIEYDDIYGKDSVCGGVIDHVANPVIGMPNNRMTRIYARGDNLTEAVIRATANNQLVIDNVELNVGTNNLLFALTQCENISIGANRVESVTYSDNSASYADIFECSGSVGQSRVDAVLDGTTSWVMFNLFSSGSALVRDLEFGNIRADITQANGGKGFVFSGSTYVNVASINKPSPEVLALTNIDGADTANYVTVRSYANDKMTIIGDEDVTIEVGDVATVLFSSALTASRSVTLPKRFGPSDVFQGLRYRVIKRTGAGTSHDITIRNDSGGIIDTIPASSATAFVELDYNRFGFYVANKSLN